MLKRGDIFNKCTGRKFIACLSTAILLFFHNGAFSQEQYYSQQFDNSAGLSNSCLNTVFQDSENLMWFGSWDGLNVYDGSAFHVFNYSNVNLSKSIGNNIVYDIREDKKNQIWIATIEGLSRYNKSSGSFSHYFYRRDNRSKAVDKGYLLDIDSKGVVYSTPKSETYLQYYQPSTNSFKRLKLANERPGKILKFLFDNQDRLYILKNTGDLEIYVKQESDFTKVKNIATQTAISDFFFVNNQIFFTSANQLFSLNTSFEFAKKTNLDHAVRAMVFFNKKYILAWSTKGLQEFDEGFTPSNTLINEIKYLKDVRITSFKRGNQNILWVGTDGYGVIKISKKANYFGLINRLPDGKPINIPIRAFNEVNNELWIGTKGNGIIQIKNLGKPNSSYEVVKKFNSVSDVLDNCVYAIEKGKDDYIYVGSDALGIHLYDKVLKKWFDWKSILGNYKYLPFNSVHCILVDDDGSVWLGLESYGLIHLKIEKINNTPRITYLTKYPYTGNSLGPVNNVIYSLVNGKDNQLYVGCRYGGLSVFDKKTQKFKTFKAFSYDGSLSNNDVLSLYKDNKNILWIGTSYGLNYIPEQDLNKPKPIFKKFTTENGLPNNTIHTITQDNEGFVWASTNKGLVKIDYLTQKIIRFKESDGLQSDEFSDNAVFKNKDGVLFFGGIYGFNYFIPKNIKTSVFQPNLLLSDLQLAG
ncbi:MAG TPA: two-component regulator propeller domain-containing protein, partial [Pelobium sp.]|nr:two-component regulator propeller domain-containing protein [Pelobium sp.]